MSLNAQSTDEEILQEIGPAIIAAFRQQMSQADPLALDPSAVPEYVAPADPMQPGEAEADVKTLSQEITLEKAALEFVKTALPIIIKAAGGI